MAQAAIAEMSPRRYSAASPFTPSKRFDLAHHPLVRLLVGAGDAVSDLLLLHPHADVRRRSVEELGVLRLGRRGRSRRRISCSHASSRRARSASRNSFMIVVAAGELLLLQPLVLGDPLAELVDLGEHRERRQALVLLALRRHRAARCASRAGSRRCAPRRSDRCRSPS